MCSGIYFSSYLSCLPTWLIFPWPSLVAPDNPYTETWGIGPGSKFVNTQYLATLLKATAFKAVVLTLKSVGTVVLVGGGRWDVA